MAAEVRDAVPGTRAVAVTNEREWPSTDSEPTAPSRPPSTWSQPLPVGHVDHEGDGATTTRYAPKLAPPVFARPGEVRQAEWVELDLADAEWRIPAKKDEDQTTKPGAAGVSSACHPSRAPGNHGRIKISLPVEAIVASPDQR